LPGGSVVVMAALWARPLYLLTRAMRRPCALRVTLRACADADLNVAARGCTEGATAFNGQRCTAIKLILVDEAVAEPFLEKLTVR